VESLMSYKWVKLLAFGSILAAGGALTGLCAPVQANTTTQAAPLRIALLLPLRSNTLGQAAEMVRAGFMAGYEREQDGATVSVIETSDDAEEIVSGYIAALATHDVVVGPLSRSGVSAIAHSGTVRKPTIALNQPDSASTGKDGADNSLPQQMLIMGLSVEDEARQVARWAGADRPAGKAFILATNTAWQRRAAKAFASEWQALGLAAQSMELSASGGALNAGALAQLKQRIGKEQPAALFVALDTEQTRQLRSAIGDEVPLYGTSQLNPYPLPDSASAQPLTALNGVRLVDLPWQLQADHPAVMAYPRIVAGPEQKRSADLERLYALGIDAYRVAREIGASHTRFEIDGVSGKLSVSFGAGMPNFKRVEQPAMVQDGVILPLLGQP
jgi:outer membrane PBP1 activator LpoA protein